jgi:four helix bundle suffix protein
MPNESKKQGFIPKHGGYRNLISYRKAEIIYDGTVYFTSRFYRKFDRTIDQMVQAARSGKQNIVEAIENDSPEICANSMICLIRIVTYLLSKQIQTLEKDFLEHDGLRERMTKARIESRKH